LASPRKIGATTFALLTDEQIVNLLQNYTQKEISELYNTYEGFISREIDARRIFVPKASEKNEKKLYKKGAWMKSKERAFWRQHKNEKIWEL